MDPDNAFQRLLVAFMSDDRAQAQTQLEALHEWVKQGGAMPTVSLVKAHPPVAIDVRCFINGRAAKMATEGIDLGQGFSATIDGLSPDVPRKPRA